MSVTITLPAEQRNAIHAEIAVDLRAVDDLRLAIETNDLESAHRLARRFAGELRLILHGLGWRDEVADPVEITMPADELRSILTEMRERAVQQYEAGRDEQEAFRAPWERAALVRDSCDEALAKLPER